MPSEGGSAGSREPSLSFLPGEMQPADWPEVPVPGEVQSAGRPEVPGGAEDVSCDVVVIGAGLSGLTAAHELLRRDPTVHVRVVEAKDRVGGRTLVTQMRAKGGVTEPFDLGGQWVGTAQTEIMETLDELGLEVYRQYNEGATQVQLGGATVRRLGSVPPIGLWRGAFQLWRLSSKVESLAGQYSADSAARNTALRELDGLTVDAFTRQHVSSGPALEAVAALIRGEYGCEANRVSLIHFLSDTSGSGGLSGMVDAQEFKVKGGTQQISELLVDRIGRQRLHLSHPVTGVSQRDDGGVTVTTAPGATFRCKSVISAIPPSQLPGIQFDPPLSPVKQEVVGSMQMGQIIKFLVTYEKAFWREAGLSGAVLSSGGGGLSASPASPGTGPITAVTDATTPGDSPALVGFIAGNDSLQWQTRTKAERENAVIAHLVQFFGKDAHQYIEYQEKVWAEEPYIGGGPGCNSVPGTMSMFPALLEPHGRVLFCGADFSTQWPGFLSGAVRTGRMAALTALYGLRPAALSAADLHLIGKRRTVRPPTKRRPAWDWETALGLAIRPFVVFFLVFVNRRFLGGGIGALGIDV